MSNARKLSKLVVGTQVKATGVDSDLSTTISSLKTRLDSDDAAVQALSITAAALTPSGLTDSDLKIVADLRSQLDSEILSSRSLSLDYTNYIYTATAGQTTFTGSDDNSATLSYTAGTIQVFLNGILLDGSDYTATSGTSVVLNEAAALDNELAIIVPRIHSTYGTVAASTHDWSSTPTNTQAFQPSNIADNDKFGTSVAIDRNYAVIGSQGRDDSINWANGSQLQMLKAGTPENNAHYGFDVSISNDGNYAAVGAKEDDEGGTNRGLVHIYLKSGSTWSEQATIQSTDISNGDQFGASVALNSDGTTLIVGAWFDDSNGAPGSAYVFTRSGTSWSQQAKLDPNDYTSGTWYFGNSCDVSDDGNTAIISAPYARVGSNDAQGAAYIFKRTDSDGGTGWEQTGKLTASDGAGDDAFSGDIMGVGDSHAVGISGDGNYAVVGAPYDDDGGTFRGTAFIFYYNGSSWSQQQKIQSSGLINKAYFGWGVAIDEDGDTIVVGANHNSYDNATDRKGKAFIWTRSGTTWSQQAELQHSDHASLTTAAFGWGVDIDSTGNHVIIGARNASVAYAFNRSGTSWTQVKKYTPDNYTSDDYFGAAISISSDGKYFIAGAEREDTTLSNSGAAYVFEGVVSNSGGAYVYYKESDTWSQQQFIQGPDSENVYIGEAVAIGGTSEGQRIAIGSSKYDGLVRWYERTDTTWSQAGSDVTNSSGSAFGYQIRMSGDTTVVGAYYESTSGSEAGRVYVYTGAGNAQANFVSSDIAAGDRFGLSIDIDGDLIVVGAPWKPEGGTRRGASYVFERSGTTWTQKAKLNHSDQGDNDRFGMSVACYEGDDGTNTIAIGALKYSGTPEGAGAVYVFTGSGTSYTQQQKLTASDAAASDLFGAKEQSLSIDKRDGNALFIAAQDDDDNSLTNSGSVYVFNRSGSTWSQSYKLNQFTIGPSANAKFGNSVNVDQNGSLIVGANADDEGGTDRGAVYVIDAQD